MSHRDLITGLQISLIVLLLPSTGSPIERMASVGAREAALSLAVVALPGPFSVFHNQAFLTENKNFAANVSYRQPYFIQGYQQSALSLVCPIQAAVIAVGVSQSAIADYKESNIGISIAKKLSEKLSAGILINYFCLNFPEEGGHKGSFQVDGGIGYRFSTRLSLGFHLRNIAESKIETFQYCLSFPLIIRGGASFLLTEQIMLVAEAIYDKQNRLGLRNGLEYELLGSFWIRGGISTNPFQHSFGLGYRWNLFQLDFAMVHHEILGFTPTFSVSINIIKCK
jgi:hypothetical protein